MGYSIETTEADLAKRLRELELDGYKIAPKNFKILRIKSGNETLEAIESANAGDAHPDGLLLLHAFTRTAILGRTFRYGVDAMQHTPAYQVLMLTFRGHGNSTGQRNLFTMNTLREDAEAALQYMIQAGVKRVSLFGNSIGAVATMQLALMHPDIISSQVLYEPFTCLKDLELRYEKKLIKKMGKEDNEKGAEGIPKEMAQHAAQIQLSKLAAQVTVPTKIIYKRKSDYINSEGIENLFECMQKLSPKEKKLVQLPLQYVLTSDEAMEHEMITKETLEWIDYFHSARGMHRRKLLLE